MTPLGNSGERSASGSRDRSRTDSGASTGVSPLLDVSGLTAGYGRTRVLREVNLSVTPSSVVALLGANGVGKTTLLSSVAGLIRIGGGRVTLEGSDITSIPAHKRAERGLCLIPEGRGIFRSLTVRENLALQIPSWCKGVDISAATEAFPVLRERQNQVAGSLSGGEQRMLALARAYLCQPKVVLVDEVSIGLAPKVVSQIFDSLKQLAQSGVALLIVEQYVSKALQMADSAYIMRTGRIIWNGPAVSVTDEILAQAYLGDSG